MSRDTIRSFLIVSAVLSSGLCTDDRIQFPDDVGNPGYSQQPSGPAGNDGVESRFLPFSSSFSVGLGENRGHSIGISSNKDGISLSQSTSLGGNGPVAGSKSNSFSVGKSGLAASDSGAYNIFGKADANTNAFSLGDATASSQADVKDGKVSSGAQSGVGNEHNRASSGASSSADEHGNTKADADANANQDDRYPNRRFFGQRNPNGPLGSLFSRPFVPHRESGLRINVGKFHGHAPHQWQNGNTDVQIRKERPNGSGLEVNVDRYNPHGPNQWTNGNPGVHIVRDQPHGLDVNIGSYDPGRHHQGHSGIRITRPNREKPWDRFNCGNRFSCGNFNQGLENSNQFQPNQNQPGFLGQPQFQQNQPGGTRVSAASASSSASSSGSGFAFGHSSSQSNSGPGGPSSKTNNQLHTSGDAQSQAQGAAAGVQENAAGQTQGSFSSGIISGSSKGHGQSTGSAVAENKGEHSRGEVNNSADGPGSAAGNANAAGVSFDDPPSGQRLPSGDDIIPSEFVRSGLDDDEPSTARAATTETSKIRRIFSGVRGAVRDILHH